MNFIDEETYGEAEKEGGQNKLTVIGIVGAEIGSYVTEGGQHGIDRHGDKRHRQSNKRDEFGAGTGYAGFHDRDLREGATPYR